MKMGAMVAILAIADVVVQAKGEFRRLPVVTVYVQRGFSDMRLSVPSAEGIASEMFSKAGVQIQWKTGSPKTGREAHPILIEITSDTPETIRAGVFAYARVFEGPHIRIFWDRIERACGESLADKLLGHVLAHEITHILQGIDHHSQEGLMKARWTAHDILQMAYKPLPFEAKDVRLIHYGLEHYCLAGPTARSRECSAPISHTNIASSKR